MMPFNANGKDFLLERQINSFQTSSTLTEGQNGKKKDRIAFRESVSIHFHIVIMLAEFYNSVSLEV